MGIIESSLHVDYVPSWGALEGIREILQNGIDGEREHGAKLSVRHQGDKLFVSNEGVTVPKEALLLGYTTKRDRSDLSGQFGEGLNLGILALVRAGHEVVIRNNGEVWRPEISGSENFESLVLKIRTRTVKPIGKFQVEIGQISKDVWEQLKPRFLFLQPARRLVQTSYGDLIMDPDKAGMIFVRGIFVERRADFTYGYDLHEAEIDRDRKMIEVNDLRWTTGSILNEAARKDERLIQSIYSLLQSDAEDTKSLGYSWSAPTEELAGRFEEVFGRDAIPCTSLEQSREVENLGKKGVIVPGGLMKVLEKARGSFDERKSKVLESKVRLVSWGELTDEEKDIFETTVAMVSMAIDVDMNMIDIAEFADELTMGRYHEGHVQISRKVLEDAVHCLATLCHELCHYKGADGSLAFHFTVEELLAKVAVANCK